MLLTKSQLDSRLSSKDNLINKMKDKLEIRPLLHGGAKLDGTASRLSFEEQVLVGSTSRLIGSKNTSDMFNISRTHAKNLALGQLDYASGPKKELAERIYGKLSDVRDKAVERLMESLELLDEEKMKSCNAKDLSAVAANMARVVDRTIPKESNEINRLNLVVYAPRLKEVKEFEMVEVG